MRKICSAFLTLAHMIRAMRCDAMLGDIEFSVYQKLLNHSDCDAQGDRLSHGQGAKNPLENLN